MNQATAGIHGDPLSRPIQRLSGRIQGGPEVASSLDIYHRIRHVVCEFGWKDWFDVLDGVSLRRGDELRG